jgi:uncharacterized repeat protein (TIGR03803 family)
MIGLLEDVMKFWSLLLSAVCILCFFAATSTVSLAQTIHVLANFDATSGGDPFGPPVQGTDGDFYGTTGFGGAYGGGSIYKVTPAGTFTTLYDFCAQTNCADGTGPDAELLLATDGNFYGTTRYGGAFAVGVVFRITPSGAYTTVFSFDHTHGACPLAGLVQGADGALYGTTATGGTMGRGTIFKITLSGKLTTLYSLGSHPSDGTNPETTLVLGSDGNFYGNTVFGGDYTCVNGCGTIFSITPAGVFTGLHKFRVDDGDAPEGALMEASDGNFYGTTYSGGVNGLGTIFRMSAAGSLTVLYSFGLTTGSNPKGGVIEGTDNNLYGTTFIGGTHDDGTVFMLTTTGTLTTLGNFGNGAGASPIGAMVQGTDGNFYGTAFYAGTGGFGTVFGISTGLGPFIRTLPLSGSVGATVRILGNKLTGASSVSFNGTPATFTVLSPTLIETTVPTGATTGTVQVTTLSGILASNTVFTVR